MKEPTIQELAWQIHESAGQIKVLEERMNTRQAEYESAIDRLRADMAARDRDNMRWFIGIGIAIIALLVGNLIAPIFGG